MAILDLDQMREIIEVALDNEVPPETFSWNAHLYEDLGMDSMGAVVMVVEIQKRIKIRISDDDVPKLMTPRDVAQLVQRLLSQTEASGAAVV